MRDKSSRIYRQGACGLDRISQLQSKRCSQPRRAFCDIGIEINKLPGVEHSAITTSGCIIVRPEWTCQHFTNGDRSNSESQPAGGMRFEQWPKMRTVPGMPFEEVDYRGGIDQEKSLVRQIIDF
jgi:hypothetical protein